MRAQGLPCHTCPSVHTRILQCSVHIGAVEIKASKEPRTQQHGCLGVNFLSPVKLVWMRWAPQPQVANLVAKRDNVPTINIPKIVKQKRLAGCTLDSLDTRSSSLHEYIGMYVTCRYVDIDML